MNTLRINQKAASIDTLQLAMTHNDRPAAGDGQCVIEVHSAGVNMSDAKAALGAMPHAVWPRTPGRDYAGIVIDGPAHLVGTEVWGSGGELGIRRDGTHARYLVVATEAVRAKPPTVGMLEAGAVGVPFITAYEGLRRAGLPKAGEVVLVMGGNGKVGQATIQLATRAGARVFAVERKGEGYIGHASGEVDMIAADSTDIATYVRDKTGGHGADIVFNTVGSPYFEQANRALAIGGRQVFIATIDKQVPFDIFAFYRGQHTYVGIDTLALDSLACARILDLLAPGFADRSLRPFPVAADTVFALRDASAGYRAVLGGSRERVVLQPMLPSESAA
jgi:NADPH:quinone reductase-like Zn-dependent oxidoreductase